MRPFAAAATATVRARMPRSYFYIIDNDPCSCYLRPILIGTFTFCSPSGVVALTVNDAENGWF